eukprot:2351891-Rhodomonas_salina.1
MDFYSQHVRSDTSSILRVEDASLRDDDETKGGLLEVLGLPSLLMQQGKATFHLAVKPTFSVVDAGQGKADLLGQPRLVFRGTDAESRSGIPVEMVSHPVPLNLSSGGGVCPRGYVLELADRSAGTGRQGTCKLCAVGTYALQPLIGAGANSQPACLPCTAGGDCRGGADVHFAVGEWKEQGGMFRLASCPAGHEFVNSQELGGPFDHAAQQCRQCTGLQYITDPNQHSCQSCPPGLRCSGTDAVDPVVAGSAWRAVGPHYILLSCPSGFSVVNTSLGAFAPAEQRCEPCGKGEQCVSEPCQACTLCPPGTFKAASGPQPCAPCPPNRYGVIVGATREDDCEPCAVGGLCANGQCALAVPGLRCDDDGTGILGSWSRIREGAWTGRWQLLSCPAGHRIINSTATESDLQRHECQKCPEGYFITNPNDPSARCQRCPESLTCIAGSPPTADPLISGVLVLSGLSGSALTDAALDAIKRSILRGMGAAEHSHIDVLVSSGRRNEASGTSRPAVQLSFHVVADAASAEAWREAAAAPAFAHALEVALAADGYVVNATAQVEAEVPVGTFAVKDNELHILSCPAGSLLVNSSLDEQGCARCEPLTYSFDYLDGCGAASCPPRRCQKCPVGAQCSNGDVFEPRVVGSVWARAPDEDSGNSAMRLTRCPSGHILVRNDDPVTGGPEFDQCVEW